MRDSTGCSCGRVADVWEPVCRGGSSSACSTFVAGTGVGGFHATAWATCDQEHHLQQLSGNLSEAILIPEAGVACGSQLLIDGTGKVCEIRGYVFVYPIMVAYQDQ